MPDRTFGIELEFQDNVNALAATLARKRLTATDHMHRYHCDCEQCSLTNGYPFHFQTDSTCGGECISRVFESIEEAVPLFVELQTAAVETDAEPSMRAGMHVHVSPGRLGATRLMKAFTAFVNWEPALIILASGRFEKQRPGMNKPVANLLAMRYYERGLLARSYDNQPSPLTGILPYPRLLELVANNAEQAYQLHHENDRHSNLNLKTRYNTWEHRWPNSTRVAWRMEMFVRVSMAMFENEVINAMIAGPPVDRTEEKPAELLTKFAKIIREADPRASDLILQQKKYMEQAANNPIPAYLSAAG